MSKADGWRKRNSFEWMKYGETYRAEITKVTGNLGYPYMWDVYPLPRADHINDQGRYMPISKGSEKTLSEAKKRSESVISKWVSS